MPKIRHNMDQIGRDIGSLIESYARLVERDVDATMQAKTGDLRTYIIEGWPVDTTASRTAWQGPLKLEHAYYELRNEIPYAPVIEYGGYPGVGPKTAEQGGETLPGGIQVNPGIYPTQVPSAPVRRALSRIFSEVMDGLNRVLSRRR